MRFLFFLFPFSLCASWADETLLQMTLDEKIGQLFALPFCPLRGEDHLKDWEILQSEYHIGNAIVKQSNPMTQILRLNQLQAASKLPLLILADAEWGLAMRMTDTIAFPKNGNLGSIEDLSLIEELGFEIGREAKRVGIHINLAPVADVNSNPSNPIIGIRSFGDNPYRVADLVSAFIRGHERAGTLACAKHFPGHGDTSIDSHKGLPLISVSKKRLGVLEFIPFQKAIDSNVSCIMSAHILVPQIDPDHPASLSSFLLREILRQDLNFKGLIISDALNMRALADRYSVEKIAFLAHGAGTDLLLYGDHKAPNIDQIIRVDIPRAFNALKEKYLAGSLKDLDESVLRILKVKEKLRLHEDRFISPEHLLEDLSTAYAIDLNKRLLQARK
ncbi:MAG: hypothetical protein A3E80_00515 [Chlamydiae bacterium RIFCSPHIGHO2_12_FULL_49_9]|nr:MAG: hypothetical protein A3E80_00515 [Chlamydiae bacterium RIFCSPHIGHO2_12_FULL_49_9]